MKNLFFSLRIALSISVIIGGITAPHTGQAQSTPSLPAGLIQAPPPTISSSPAPLKPAKKHSSSEEKKKKSAQPAIQPIEKIPEPSLTTVQFFRALSNYNFEIANLLLQQGADVNCPNCGGPETPGIFMFSHIDAFGRENESNSALDFLLRNGANPNSKNGNGQTILIRTIIPRGPTTIEMSNIRRLISAGAKVTEKTSDGDTALHFLAAKQSVLMFRPSQTRNYPDPAVAMYEKKERDFIEAAMLLLQQGADINAQNEMGVTPLMRLVENCNTDEVNFFLSRGARKDLRDTQGRSAFDYAVSAATTRTNSKNCNDTVMLVKSSPIKSYVDNQAKIGDKTLVGVFTPRAPRGNSMRITADLTAEGAIAFSSQSGLTGRGQGGFTGKNFMGEVVSTIPGVDGGTQEVRFDLNGELAGDGVLRGFYTSAIESGEFALCDKASNLISNDCRANFSGPSSGPGVKEVASGVLNLLNAISGATRR